MEPLGLSLDGGTLRRIPPNATVEEQINALNEVIEKLNALLKTQIFADNTSKRYLSGYYQGRWPGGDFGIAISREGEDATTVDFDQLLYAHDFTTGTEYFWDPIGDRQWGQQGKLPDGTYGFAIANEGDSIEDGFS